MTDQARPPLGPGGPPSAYPPAGPGGPPSAYPVPTFAGPGPAGAGTPVPPPPRETWRPPRRVDPVPGTPFALAYLEVAPITSGLAVGALTAGIASIVVSLVVLCFGLVGAEGGWGAWAAGAFSVLGGLLGAAAIVLGVLGRRQTRREAPPPAVRFVGSGLAVSGIWCGAVGLTLTVLALTLAIILQLS
ncbi:phage holin family protein [Micromonospora sp. NPDC050397]|uniref:phage holin family protein n=1 Tax=Micromonospora sp. NPDC050397 TaxID=3364279 RepID=UPI00384C933B